MSSEAVLEPPPGASDSRGALGQRMASAGEVEKIERALQFAALSGRFDPEDALAAAGYPPPSDTPDAASLQRLAAVAALVDACDTRLWQPYWIMRAQARERCVALMGDRSAEIVAWRSGKEPFDSKTRDVCEALLGIGEFAPERVAAVLAAGAPPRKVYEKLIRGIALTQPLAPAGAMLDGLRAALAGIQQEASDAAAEAGAALQGRDADIARGRSGIARQLASQRPQMALGAVYFEGAVGVGKSSLLDEIERLETAGGAIGATLDFDRPGIDGHDPLGLSREVARQVAGSLGASGAQLHAAIAKVSVLSVHPGETLRLRAERLLEEIGRLLATADRPLLVVLDGLEMLVRHGDTAAFSLLEWLRTAKVYVPRLAIVGAGRQPLPAVFSEEAETVHLTLPEAAARQQLAGPALAGTAAQDILALADGDPLVLDLATKLVRAGGGATRQAPFSEQPSAERAFGLYRQIIARIPDPRGRKLACGGLLLRQVNPPVLAEVVAPRLGLTLTTGRAAELLGQFAQNAWLVEEREGWLLHCAAQRPALLERQIVDDPLLAARMFKAAAAWHRAQDDPVLTLYYELQLLRWRRRAPLFEPSTPLLLGDDMIAELPRPARDLVAVARGERSTRLRAAAEALSAMAAASAERPELRPGRQFDPGAADELRMLLNRRRHAEAAAMVSRAGDFSGIDPGSEQAAAVIEALWRVGRWNEARLLLGLSRARRTGELSFARDVTGNVAAMCAAFADLDPVGFRNALRIDRRFADLVFDVSASTGEGSDWDVAGLLMLAEGLETRSTYARTVWETWTGPATTARRCEEACRQLSNAGRALPLFTEAASLDDLIDALLPDPSHTRMVQHRLQLLDPKPLAVVAPLIAALLPVLADAGSGLVAPGAASYAVDHADSRGELASVVSALALLEPDAGFGDLARAARQRAATSTGHWSYGDVPAGWRQSPTGWQTAQSLGRYAGPARERRRQAADDLARWRDRLGGGSLKLLADHCEAIAREATPPAVGRGAARLQGCAQSLIDAGLPAVLAPTFAVLVASGTDQSSHLSTPGSHIGPDIVNLSNREG